MGSNRDIAFVKEVYRATVEDFMIPAPGTDKERAGKHGRKNAKQVQLAELSGSFVTPEQGKQWRNRQEIDRDEGAGFWDGAESKQVCNVVCYSPLSRPSACLAPVRTSTKGLPFQLAMALCNAPRDASAFFRATPPRVWILSDPSRGHLLDGKTS